MSVSHTEFSSRVSRLGRQHRAMGRGYTASLRGDGLIVVHPRRLQFKLPVRGFVLLMVAFMVFKGFMVSYLGDATYDARLDVLRSGSLFGEVGAFVMGVDPVANVIAVSFNTIIK
ncbi:MAG: hypothetical protein ABJL99_24230 [Aliishimia sp.]